MGTACKHKENAELMPELVLVKKIMDEYPDSALHLVHNMEQPSPSDKWQYANWCLLKIRAEFKNLVDTISESQLETGFNYFMKHDGHHHQKALAYYLKARVLSEKGKMGDYEFLCNMRQSAKEIALSDDYFLGHLIHSNIALIYLYRGKTDEAFEQIDKARMYAERSGNKYHQATVQSLLGKAYGIIGDETGDYSQSIKHYQQGIQIAQEIKEEQEYGQLAGELSLIYGRTKEYGLSLTYALEAAEIQRRLSKEPKYLSAADAYRHLGKTDSAIHYFRKGITHSDIYMRRSSYLGLYLVYLEDLKDYQKAMEYYTLSNETQDSIRIMQENEKIAGMEEENAKLKALDERNRMKQERDASRRLWVFSVCIFTAFITFIFYRYKRKFRQKEKLLCKYTMQLHDNENLMVRNKQLIAELQEQIADEQEIHEQSEEQRKALATLQQRNETLCTENLRLQQHIDNYKNFPKKQEIEVLKENAKRVRQLEERERQLTEELANNNELMRRLRQNPKFLEEPEWKKLRLVTDKVYTSFTQRLTGQFPQLTEVDMQLCILMKLRFTVSQIAILTAVSPASVSVQKQRLKKRILQTDENLLAEGQTVDMWIWEF